MSKLPILVCPHETFTFNDGQCIEIRGLSRAEAIQARTFGDEDISKCEVHIIKCATGSTEQEASHWHSLAPSGEVERLVDKVAELSGLKEATGKADAEASHSAKSTE